MIHAERYVAPRVSKGKRLRLGTRRDDKFASKPHFRQIPLRLITRQSDAIISGFYQRRGLPSARSLVRPLRAYLVLSPLLRVVKGNTFHSVDSRFYA